MKIYFIGMPFLCCTVNYGAAILRAVGDTKRPLMFLIISGVINAILNLILVIVFHLDVAGVCDRDSNFSVHILYPDPALPV